MTDCGIVTDDRAQQPENAELPIDSTESGMNTDSRLAHPENDEDAIAVTVSPRVILETLEETLPGKIDLKFSTQ